MLRRASWAVLVVLAASSASCMEEAGGGNGAAYVLGPGGNLTAHVAWTFEACDDAGQPLAWARMTGAAPVIDGQFEVDDLLELESGPGVPAAGCVVIRAEVPDGEDPAPVIEALDPAWGLLVATSDEIDDPSMPLAEPGNFLDVRREDLEPWVRAGSTDVAVVWSSVTRTRDSLEGQLHESSIRSGAQLMRVVDCRLTVTGHDACFDPLPEDAVILLGN